MRSGASVIFSLPIERLVGPGQVCDDSEQGKSDCRYRHSKRMI
jgi:hypothetical protein